MPFGPHPWDSGRYGFFRFPGGTRGDASVGSRTGALCYRARRYVSGFERTANANSSNYPMRPLRDYLAAIAFFCNEVKDKNALALSHDLGLPSACPLLARWRRLRPTGTRKGYDVFPRKDGHSSHPLRMRVSIGWCSGGRYASLFGRRFYPDTHGGVLRRRGRGAPV